MASETKVFYISAYHHQLLLVEMEGRGDERKQTNAGCQDGSARTDTSRHTNALSVLLLWNNKRIQGLPKEYILRPFFYILFVCNRGDTYYSITAGSRQEAWRQKYREKNLNNFALSILNIHGQKLY